MSSERMQIRPARQQRSQETFERVLVAGAGLLREVGFAGFTLQAVSERAGVGVGSIYLRAPSREALVLAIHDRELDRMDVEEEEIVARVLSARLEPAAHIESLIVGTGALMLRNADILSVFMTIGPSDKEIWRRGAERSRQVGARFASALEPIRAHISHPDPGLATDIVFRITYDTIARRISRGERFESERALDDSTLLRELARIGVTYLLGAPSA